MQVSDAVTGVNLRTKDLHDSLVQEIQKGDAEQCYGVKRSCVLSDHLKYFHPLTGFPPDVLHDLFEGVVPVELAHCLKSMIAKKKFTLEELNRAIRLTALTQFLKLLSVEEQLVGMDMRITLSSGFFLFSLAPESQKETNSARS